MIEAAEFLPQTPQITAPRRKVRKLHIQAAEREAKRAARSRQKLAKAQARVDAARATEKAAFERLTRLTAEFEALQRQIRAQEALATPMPAPGRKTLLVNGWWRKAA